MNKTLTVRKSRNGKAALVGGAATGAAVLSTMAHAELDAGVSTDIGAAKTDVKTAGGLIIGVVLAIAVIAWIRRVLH